MTPSLALATLEDTAAIRACYDDARNRQRELAVIEWPEFSEDSIRAEIAERRLWKVQDGGLLAGVFTAAYSDPAIWRERELHRHIYLHRIARAPGSRMPGLFAKVLDWAIDHARERGAAGIRMDTWASNDGLIAYYARFGFELVARVRLDADLRLPAHYHGNDFALLERPSDSAAGPT